MAKDIIEVWTAVVQGAAQRQRKPTGIDTDSDDDVQPFTG